MPDGAQGTPIIMTSSNSWGESDIDTLLKTQVAELGPDDQQGPVTLAVAVTKPVEAEVKSATDRIQDLLKEDPQNDDEEDADIDIDVSVEEETEARVVVFGDSDFITNRLYRQSFDLFINGVNWLTHQEDQITIRPKDDFGDPLFVNPVMANVVFYSSIFFLPLVFAIIGIFVAVMKGCEINKNR